MDSSVAKAFADGLEHHRHGRLAEAEAAYRSVLERVPEHPDALHRLGVLAQRAGRNETALALIERAIAVDPARPAYLSDAAVVLHALGRVDEAIARYREALVLEAQNPRLCNALGIALEDRGRLADAAESFRAALALDPDYVAALNNLANVLREQRDAAGAATLYRRALSRRANSPDLWRNLGNALTDLRALGEAVGAYRNALALRRDRETHARLGDALLALDQADEAVTQYACALAIAESPDVIASFVHALVAARLDDADDDVRRMAIRALSVPWTRPANVAAACIRLLHGVPAVRACIDRARKAWPSRLEFASLFGADAPIVLGEPMLRLLLESAPVCDPGMERFLTLARCALLNVADANGACDDAMAFACALARQCFIDDYVFSLADGERDRIARLCDRLAARLHAGETPKAFDVAVAAAYAPLASLPHAEALLSLAWPAPLASVLAQQLREPAEERAARERIPRLTTIDEGVSAKVRAQYEQHPYPRWVKMPPSSLASSAESRGGRFPHALLETDKDHLDILIAGCGTGQESIEIAQAFPRSRVLAVDLSLASLAYAERKARALGIANVEHAQADLVKLASLDRCFDLISSVGVLHHLADPERGIADLASLLAPGGHMLIGLYSERARRDVVAARAFIAEHDYRPTNDDIRRCRQALMEVDGGRTFSRLAMRADFYVTAECRDLLFHVEEHRFTLPQIARCLDTLALRFAGFLLPQPIAKRYAERFPDDAAMDDLRRWDAFEAEFPDAFAGMYIFWVRKEP